MTIVDDDPVELPCARCQGEGSRGDMECGACSGSGADWFDRSELFTLAHNLAVAGALCEAHNLALDEAEGHSLHHAHGYRLDGCWSPGCGRAAT